MTLREIIKKLCKDKGISVNKLEEELGFAKGYVSKLDKSKPNSAKLQQIADFFDVSLDYLMTGKDNRLSKKNAELDYTLLTDDDSRGILIEYQSLDSNRKNMLKKYLEFLKNDMK